MTGKTKTKLIVGLGPARVMSTWLVQSLGNQGVYSPMEKECQYLCRDSNNFRPEVYYEIMNLGNCTCSIDYSVDYVTEIPTVLSNLSSFSATFSSVEILTLGLFRCPHQRYISHLRSSFKLGIPITSDYVSSLLKHGDPKTWMVNYHQVVGRGFRFKAFIMDPVFSHDGKKDLLVIPKMESVISDFYGKQISLDPSEVVNERMMPRFLFLNRFKDLLWTYLVRARLTYPIYLYKRLNFYFRFDRIFYCKHQEKMSKKLDLLENEFIAKITALDLDSKYEKFKIQCRKDSY